MKFMPDWRHLKEKHWLDLHGKLVGHVSVAAGLDQMDIPVA
jgi:hypothetical protein